MNTPRCLMVLIVSLSTNYLFAGARVPVCADFLEGEPMFGAQDARVSYDGHIYLQNRTGEIVVYTDQGNT